MLITIQGRQYSRVSPKTASAIFALEEFGTVTISGDPHNREVYVKHDIEVPVTDVMTIQEFQGRDLFAPSIPSGWDVVPADFSFFSTNYTNHTGVISPVGVKRMFDLGGTFAAPDVHTYASNGWDIDKYRGRFLLRHG